MIRYVIQRLLWTGIVLIGVSAIMFLLVFAQPGDPALALVGGRASKDSIEQVRKQYQLDQPIQVQYASYMGRLLRGDLGESYYSRQPVAQALLAHFPATALLAGSIILVAVVIGIPLGILGALKSNTPIDRGLMITQLLAISMPSFFFGLMLLYLFAFQLKLVPVGGYGSLKHLILPTLSVALPWAGWYAIILRSNLLETISNDYVRTAYAKGLNQRSAALRHMLPNAILPVVTMVGMDLAGLLTGIALVEYLFNWPGIGWQTLQAAQRLDVPMIMGSVLFGALLIGLANLAIDLLYTVLDPRVRLNM
ncbi:MAG TPA: ABC transporter permease [Roseiflexaceae bacterium]|nr:ABC transporter permease [Roseiflexaceae bacterium]